LIERNGAPEGIQGALVAGANSRRDIL
jgi:hypothetical protein